MSSKNVWSTGIMKDCRFNDEGNSQVYLHRLSNGIYEIYSVIGDQIIQTDPRYANQLTDLEEAKIAYREIAHRVLDDFVL